MGAEGVHGVNTFTKYKSFSKTFVKYCFEQYGIKNIGDIKKSMFYDFMEDKMKNGKTNDEKYSAKTIGQYKNAIFKMSEQATKMGREYEDLAELSKPDVQGKFKELKEKYDVYYSKGDYKRGKNRDGKLGYSYEEARKIAKKANELSPLHGALYEVLAYAAPRHKELLGIKWRQIDTVNNRIYLDDPNQNKNGRPRFIPITEATSQKLEGIMDSGFVPNRDTRIWGSRISQDDMYNLTKGLCRKAHVGYSAIHDFRRAAVEVHERELKKELKKGTPKEELVNRLMDFVGMDPKLNPIVMKMEKRLDENGKPVRIPLTNKEGKILTYPNGKPRFKYDWIPKLDSQKNPIYDYKYTKAEVMTWRNDKLINSMISQILGHNRTSATSPYKNG